MSNAEKETPKIYADPERQIERLKIEGNDYVLMREEIYQQMLEEIESLDSALDLQRAQAEANLSVSNILLHGNYTPQQIREILAAPDTGKKIALMRAFRNLNQEQLAEQASVSQATISNIENGRVKFRADRAAARILGALGVTKAGAFSLLSEAEEEEEKRDSSTATS